MGRKFSLCVKENLWKMQFASYTTFFVCVVNMSSSKPNIITTF